MTSDAQAGSRILGSLRSADGTGIVRVEDRYDTSINEARTRRKAELNRPFRFARHGPCRAEMHWPWLR
jgi:hypothetical protein